MSDETVERVLDTWRSLAFANGLPAEHLRPFADIVVNRLRAAGYTDDQILTVLESQP